MGKLEGHFAIFYVYLLDNKNSNVLSEETRNKEKGKESPAKKLR